MHSATISQITKRLRDLPQEKLVVVLDFVSYLTERESAELLQVAPANTVEFMLASEKALRRDWDRPEEDAAWASL